MRTALARLVSVLGHPFSTMLLVATVAGAYAGIDAAILATVGVVLPLTALIVQRRRSGRWRTVDASDPHDRPALFVVALAAVVAVLAALLVRGDLVIARWIASIAAIFGVAAFLDARIKTSLHMAFAAFAGISLLAVSPRVACVVLAMLPVLGWSRRHLQRHTTREILTGAGLGAIAAGFAIGRFW